MSAKRILVCGGREYDDATRVWGCLTRVYRKYPHLVIVHGNARGADSLARDWAIRHNVPHEAHPADWDRHGKKAGPIRNQEMLDSGLDGGIAFPGGRGTADMVRKMKAAGVPVWEVGDE